MYSHTTLTITSSVRRSSRWGQLTQQISSCHRERVAPTLAAVLICLHLVMTSLVPVVTAAPVSPPVVEPPRLLHMLLVCTHSSNEEETQVTKKTVSCACSCSRSALYFVLYMCRYSSSDPVVQSERVTGAGPADADALFHQEHNKLALSV